MQSEHRACWRMTEVQIFQQLKLDENETILKKKPLKIYRISSEKII